MATQVVSGVVSLQPQFTQVQSSGVVGPTTGGGSSSLSTRLTIYDQINNIPGSALGFDQLYSAQLTLAASPTTIHFETATAHDMFGNTIAMLRIGFLAVQNISTVAGHDVKVESSASNGIPWLPPSTSPLFARANNGLVIIYDPNSFGGGVGNVVGATTDGMTLDPGANTCTVNVWVAGSTVA